MRWVVVGLLLAGCGGPTTLAVDVVLADGAPAPSARLAGRVFDPLGALTTWRPLADNTLPGTLVVEGLAAREQTVRLVIDGGSVLGGVALATRPGGQVRATLALGPPVDRDGDRVPDELDGCPDAADPEQLDLDRDGIGDACDGEPPDAAGGMDLSHPPSLCESRPGLAFCDGFEGGALAGHWSENRNVTLVGEAHRGSGAARLTAPTGTGAAALISQVPFDALSGGFWARLFVRLPAERPPYASLLEVATASGSNGMILASTYGSLQYDEYGFTPKVSRLGTLPLVTGTFACVEWHVGDGEIRAFIDGVEVPEITQTGRTIPTWETFFLLYAPADPTQQEYEAIVDELAVDAARIGCD